MVVSGFEFRQAGLKSVLLPATEECLKFNAKYKQQGKVIYEKKD